MGSAKTKRAPNDNKGRLFCLLQTLGPKKSQGLQIERKLGFAASNAKDDRKFLRRKQKNALGKTRTQFLLPPPLSPPLSPPPSGPYKGEKEGRRVPGRGGSISDAPEKGRRSQSYHIMTKFVPFHSLLHVITGCSAKGGRGNDSLTPFRVSSNSFLLHGD